MKLLVILTFGILDFVVCFDHEVALKKRWTYEMKSVTSKSSNPDLFNVSLSVERVSRGIYALSGDVKINIDIVEGDGNDVELNSYRSPHGDSDYRSIPLQMSRRHFYKAFNTHYKSVIMNTLKDCSDMPYFEDKFEPPIEKKMYVLEKCQFSQEGLPNYIESGQYKIILKGFGTVEWEVELIVEVETTF